MPTDGVNKKRRRFLVATTSVVGAVGAGFAAVPFIKSWKPSAKARAVGAPVQVMLDGLDPGQLLKVQWRGQTIGVLRRSKETVGLLPELDQYLRDPQSAESEQPVFAQNEGRALKEEFLVVNMHCTHLGCVPQLLPQVGPQPFEENWNGGFFCPCHKSKFDMAGRVYKGVPAPTNLRIPPYSFIDDTTLVIGVNPEGAV
ncbi:MAG: ubiquinol-cytochrome c reductase iron-sulfur subunit [Xanthomonadales bacterium]|nr:ubiquinol-cytochrome c reductase iron-sulfur subunit [Gammaproteobacteria bacterium]MBT8053321.1 ubiquinol-cytochrome c reductase iron-sulfur subunit [Gammaproteobacteria bacterium]NND58033.1 ubiquinol-cytochrome c reductase iron-sulfur subunit [Xanthomonadales bacterium]NNK52130.1 ubiquinol-cytochrome c reductase iron-sulfur subunit [Xanthomonadales bacterium]